tara:strand:+ start:19612 stop:19809 length:198 start_codon:yes stop_codon:yes gene_type:complete
MSKYDKIVQPVWVNGEIVGHFVQKRTAEEYAHDMWALAAFRKAFYKQMEGATSYRVPIIGEVEDE